jgi:nicotinamidase-related amidase
MRIKREDTALIVIDMQSKLYPFIHEYEQLTKNCIRLIEGLKVLDVPIIVTQQYTPGLGGTIEPINKAIGEYTHIEKMCFSCYGDNNFISELKKLGRKNILLAGIESHVCVLQTALDLIENGYQPVLVEDCVSSREPNNKRIAVERMRDAGAIITTYESILFELTVLCGTDEFKKIVKIVK